MITEEQVLLNNDIYIRQQTNINSISPTILAARLDEITKFAGGAYPIPVLTSGQNSLTSDKFVGIDITEIRYSGIVMVAGIGFSKDIESDTIQMINGNQLPATPTVVYCQSAGGSELNATPGSLPNIISSDVTKSLIKNTYNTYIGIISDGQWTLPAPDSDNIGMITVINYGSFDLHIDVETGQADIRYGNELIGDYFLPPGGLAIFYNNTIKWAIVSNIVSAWSKSITQPLTSNLNYTFTHPISEPYSFSLQGINAAAQQSYQIINKAAGNITIQFAADPTVIGSTALFDLIITPRNY